MIPDFGEEQFKLFTMLGLVPNPDFSQPGYAEWLLKDQMGRPIATFSTRLSEKPEIAAIGLLTQMFTQGMMTQKRMMTRENTQP